MTVHRCPTCGVETWRGKDWPMAEHLGQLCGVCGARLSR